MFSSKIWLFPSRDVLRPSATHPPTDSTAPSPANPIARSHLKTRLFPPAHARSAHKRANKLPPFAINQRVLVQHHDSKQWSIQGVIHSVRPDGISFVIQLPSGQHIVRGRHLICPYRSTPTHTSTQGATHQPPNHPHPSDNNPIQPTATNQRPKRTIKKP